MHQMTPQQLFTGEYNNKVKEMVEAGIRQYLKG